MTLYRISVLLDAEQGITKHLGSVRASNPDAAVDKYLEKQDRDLRQLEAENDFAGNGNILSFQAIAESNINRRQVNTKNRATLRRK